MNLLRKSLSRRAPELVGQEDPSFRRASAPPRAFGVRSIHARLYARDRICKEEVCDAESSADGCRRPPAGPRRISSSRTTGCARTAGTSRWCIGAYEDRMGGHRTYDNTRKCIECGETIPRKVKRCQTCNASFLKQRPTYERTPEHCCRMSEATKGKPKAYRPASERPEIAEKIRQLQG